MAQEAKSPLSDSDSKTFEYGFRFTCGEPVAARTRLAAYQGDLVMPTPGAKPKRRPVDHVDGFPTLTKAAVEAHHGVGPGLGDLPFVTGAPTPVAVGSLTDQPHNRLQVSHRCRVSTLYNSSMAMYSL